MVVGGWHRRDSPLGGWVRQSILCLTFLTVCLVARANFCTFFPARLAGTLKTEDKVYWPSAYLNRRPLNELPRAKAKERIRAIVAAIYESESAIGLELDRVYRERQARDRTWLNDYFRAYEIFYFSPRYLDLAARIHEKLPTNGSILDLGSGTGGLSGILADAAPFRHMTLLDHEFAMTIARERIAVLFSGQDGRFAHVPFYLGPRVADLPGQNLFDGAVINHALYPMGAHTKRAALNAVRKRLKPGTPLIINEPLREMAIQPGRHREWLTQILEGSIDGGSPHTEYDIAVITAMCSGRMTQLARVGSVMQPMLTELEHEELFAETGFRIVRKESTYDGFSRMWVLQTP